VGGCTGVFAALPAVLVLLLLPTGWPALLFAELTSVDSTVLLPLASLTVPPLPVPSLPVPLLPESDTPNTFFRLAGRLSV
jgi:hypothetical protein